MRVISCLIFFLSFFFLPVACFALNLQPYGNIHEEASLNLIFCPLNYRDERCFLYDIGYLLERLKNTEPFDEFMDKIGAYYVEISPKEEGSVFKRTQRFPPLSVRIDFLESIKSYLQSEYKLIIIDRRGFSSCAQVSNLAKTSLIILGRARYKNKDSFSKGFLHELGHSLGLRDECVDCSPLYPCGPPNCAKNIEEAKKLWGDLVGKAKSVHYINGCCGRRDYIRPTIASLMNDPEKAKSFGPVNERYLRGIFKKALQSSSKKSSGYVSIAP